MEKYALEDTDEELLEKLEREETPNKSMVMDLALKASQKKTSFKSLASALEKKLNITTKRAELVAKEIKEEIIPLLTKPVKTLTKSNKKNAEKPSKPAKPDIYREPIT